MNDFLSPEPQRYSPYGLWWGYIKKRWLSYLLGAISVGMTGASQVLIPRLLGWSVDFLKGDRIPAYFHRNTPLETYTHLFLLLVLAHFVLMTARMGWRAFLANHTYRAGAWLRGLIWDKVRYFPKEKLNKEFSLGVLMNSSTSDINAARLVYGLTLVAGFDVIFLGIITLVTMFTVNAKMTLWTLLIFPILPIFVKKLSHKEGERFDDAQEHLSSFNDLCSQAVGTIRLQRLTQTGKFWERKLVESAGQYREKKLKAVFTSLNFFPYMGIGTVLSYLVLFVVGIHQVILGVMTVGEFVAMQSYVMLIQEPLMELGFIISEGQRGRTGLARLSEIYNQETDHLLKLDGAQVVEKNQVFQIRNLSFQYGETGRTILKDLHLDLRRGERLGVTGPIGSGKTTLINLMSGLENIGMGQIHFNGRPIGDYSHSSLRESIAMVPQKAFLFADTIRNNVTMDKGMSDEEVWHFLSIAGLASEVRKFPLQLETPLGEWGINLSGGQKQRLTLARALAAKPSVLLLDDCLSAVDTVTEEKILLNLDRELADTTLVWVAHRTSTLKYCHKILELSLDHP